MVTAVSALADDQRIPPPQCYSSATCYDKVTDCTSLGDALTFQARLKVHTICVAYNGVKSEFDTYDLQVGGFQQGCNPRTEQRCQDFCANELNRFLTIYDKCE